MISHAEHDDDKPIGRVALDLSGTNVGKSDSAANGGGGPGGRPGGGPMSVPTR